MKIYALILASWYFVLIHGQGPSTNPSQTVQSNSQNSSPTQSSGPIVSAPSNTSNASGSDVRGSTAATTPFGGSTVQPTGSSTSSTESPSTTSGSSNSPNGHSNASPTVFQFGAAIPLAAPFLSTILLSTALSIAFLSA